MTPVSVKSPARIPDLNCPTFVGSRRDAPARGNRSETRKHEVILGHGVNNETKYGL